MTPSTHPAALAYAAARCEARRLIDRLATRAAVTAQGFHVVRASTASREEDRAAWRAVRAALAIDPSLTDAGLVLARAADLLPTLEEVAPTVAPAPAKAPASRKGRGVRGDRPAKRSNVRGTR